MARIPRSFIDDLLNRVDIVEIIDARVPLKKKGGRYWACCPFHGEKTPSFSVSPTKQFYHCFGCQQHGNAIGFLMDYEHLDFVEAVESLARHLGIEVPYEQGGRSSAKGHRDALEPLFQALQACSEFYRQQLRGHAKARDYLKQRGISDPTAERYAIGYAPPGWDNLPGERGALLAAGMLSQNDQGRVYNRFRNRLMFPIRDRRGRVIGFGGRVIDPEDSPKYLNSPETPVFHKGEEIYGLWELKQANTRIERIFVTEGYMDVVALAEQGVSTAVATLGTAINGGQVEKLFRLCPQLVFCFDADDAGRKAAWRALEAGLPMLREGRIARFLFLPEGQDPDSYIREFGREAFLQRAEQADTLSQFLLDELLSRSDASTPEGRARFLDQLRPYYSQIPLDSLKHEVLKQLEKRLGIELDARLFQIIGGAPASHAPQRPRIPEQHWTPVRLAINLLLQKPELAARAGNLDDLLEAGIPGVELLLQLIDRIHEEPDISPQNLLSRFEGHPNEPHLYRIAAMTPAMQDEDSDIPRMFEDAIARLRDQYARHRFQTLHRKLLQGSALSPEETEEYRHLLSQRGAD